MAKLTKHLYYTAKGETKVNCFGVHISKEVVAAAGLEDQLIKVYAKDGKIIIEKA